jgi:hypothetical protein
VGSGNPRGFRTLAFHTPAETEECVLPPLAGTEGLALLTDSSNGNVVFASTRKSTEHDVPPLAPGFVSESETCPADMIADGGT